MIVTLSNSGLGCAANGRGIGKGEYVRTQGARAENRLVPAALACDLAPSFHPA